MNSNAFFWKELVDDDVWQVAETSSATSILDNTERTNLPYDCKNMCKFESRTFPGDRHTRYGGFDTFLKRSA